MMRCSVDEPLGSLRSASDKDPSVGARPAARFRSVGGGRLSQDDRWGRKSRPWMWVRSHSGMTCKTGSNGVLSCRFLRSRAEAHVSGGMARWSTRHEPAWGVGNTMRRNAAGSHPRFLGEGCGSTDAFRRRTGASGQHHLMRDLWNHPPPDGRGARHTGWMLHLTGTQDHSRYSELHEANPENNTFMGTLILFQDLDDLAAYSQLRMSASSPWPSGLPSAPRESRS
jgi:hypothetical protein